MYLTEKVPDDSGSVLSADRYPFWVKPKRPALSCWEENKICFKNNCASPADFAADADIPLPLILRIILRMLQFSLLDVIGILGPSALRSYYGPLSGMTLNAQKCSTHADLERIVLASYLLRRNTVRDLTMFEDRTSNRNLLLYQAENQPMDSKTASLKRALFLQYLSRVSLR
jgi:hypothetical protein